MAMNQAFSSFAKPSMFGDQAQNIGQAQSQFTQQGTSPFGFGSSKDGFGSFMNNFGSFGNNFGGAFNNGFTTPQYNMFGAFLGGGMGGAFQQPAPQQNIAGGFLPENFDAQAHLNNPLYQQNFNPDGSRVSEPSLARPGAPTGPFPQQDPTAPHPLAGTLGNGALPNIASGQGERNLNIPVGQGGVIYDGIQPDGFNPWDPSTWNIAGRQGQNTGITGGGLPGNIAGPLGQGLRQHFNETGRYSQSYEDAARRNAILESVPSPRMQQILSRRPGGPSNIADSRALDRMELDQPGAGQGGNLLDAFRQAQLGQRLFYT